MSHLSVPAVSARKVLADVPMIAFYAGGPRCPEDICLPSVMRALMEYLKEDGYGCKKCPGCLEIGDIPCSFAFFVGVSGAAAYLSWKKGWEGDNQAVFYMSADPEAPERNCFKAAGYSFEWVLKAAGEEHATDFKSRVVENIDRGMPVIAYGTIGPPEAGFITGYDENGEVAIGWSFFQNFPPFNIGVEYEPSGCFRKRDWIKDTLCLLTIGNKSEKPPLKETYRDALQFLLKVSRTPIVRPEPDAPAWYQERANGFAAYDAWAEQLLHDEDFLGADDATLRQRYDVHNGNVSMVAEARWYGAVFFKDMIDSECLHYDMFEDLFHAAGCYAAEHALMWKIWNLAGGNGNPEAYKAFADPAIRRQMAPVILQAKAQDIQAMKHIERALSFYQ